MSSLDRWRAEKQSAWIYGEIARCEPDPARGRMFRALAGAAEKQAAILAGDVEREGRTAPAFRPSTRARLVVGLTCRLGPRRTLPLLAALKVRGLAAYRAAPESGHPMPVSVRDIGERHRRAGRGGTLRAAVFGVNDGL